MALIIEMLYILCPHASCIAKEGEWGGGSFHIDKEFVSVMVEEVNN